jgi:hypothetical protein
MRENILTKQVRHKPKMCSSEPKHACNCYVYEQTGGTNMFERRKYVV